MRCQRAEIRAQERKLTGDEMRGVYELNALETKLTHVDPQRGGSDSKVTSVRDMLLVFGTVRPMRL